MFRAAREHNIDRFAEATSVHNDDYSRLSYYLYCATKGVGIDIIQDDLVDYKNARRLPRERKDAILKFAYEHFGPDTTVGTIFLPDQGGVLGPSRDNTFARPIFAGRFIFVVGRMIPVTKIMFFKEAWLERNYLTPIKNQTERIKQICKVKDDSSDMTSALAALLLIDALTKASTSTSDHCDHCKGLDGKCGCDQGCPIKVSTKCSKVHHCDHCKGFDGEKCTCKSGCPEGIYSKCIVEHSGITCKGCMQEDIKGARFKCAECANFDLCEKCYNQGALKHDMTHSFNRIDRVGSVLVHLEPRQPAVPDSSIPTYVYEATKAVPLDPDFVAMPPPTAPSDAPFVKATLVYDFAKGDAVTIIGLKDESMNGVSAVVEQDAPVAGGPIQVRLSEKEPGKLKYIKPENLAKIRSTFHSGQVVKLTGLDDNSMNGKIGVVDSPIPGGCIMVRLYEGKAVSIKSENLEVAADFLE